LVAFNEATGIFKRKKNEPSDINEHMETLLKYASSSDSIVELGVRAMVSTWAFILGKPSKLTCVDLYPPSKYLNDNGAFQSIAEMICKDLGIEFTFIVGNSLEVEIPKTDLLFIDTLHSYEQLSKELELHSGNVKKWIILHDTESCKDYFVDSYGDLMGGLRYSISGFLDAHPEWATKEVFTNNNGLTILERIHSE